MAGMPQAFQVPQETVVSSVDFNDLISSSGFQSLDLFATSQVSPSVARAAISKGLGIRSNPQYSLSQNGTAGANVWINSDTWYFETSAASLTRTQKGYAYLQFTTVINAAFGTADGYFIIDIEKYDGMTATQIGQVTTITRSSSSTLQTTETIRITLTETNINPGDIVRIKVAAYTRSSNAATNATNLYLIHDPSGGEVILPGAITVDPADNPTQANAFIQYKIDL